MNKYDDLARIRHLAQRIHPGGRMVRAWPLEGGVSAQVTAFEIAHPDGRTERMVLRRHGVIDKGHNPDIAADEFRLLSILHNAEMAVPRPLFVDPGGDVFEAPCLVIEYIDGSTEVRPADLPEALRQMSEYLAHLHAMELGKLQLAFLPHREEPVESILRYAKNTPKAARIRDVLATHGPLSQTNAPVLLHGDYWPGNIMWRDGRIAAVIDWEDAAIGDPLADLAGCRLELLWKFGHRAMADFTDHYLSMATVDLADLPIWELYVATAAAAHMSEWGLGADTEAEMRTHTDTFIDRALATLAKR